MRRETAIQKNDGVDMLPLELSLVRASIFCLSGARSSANMPGNAALYGPIDLQSEHPSMNTANFYKHCGYTVYIYTLKVFKILCTINLTPATETFSLQIFW